MQFSPASLNDLPVLNQQLPSLQAVTLVGNKAYSNAGLRDSLVGQQAIHLNTPVKLAKGQKRLDSAETLFQSCESHASANRDFVQLAD